MNSQNTKLSTLATLLGLFLTCGTIYAVYIGTKIAEDAIVAQGIRSDLYTCTAFGKKQCKTADNAEIDYVRYRQNDAYSTAINKVLLEQSKKAGKLVPIAKAMPEAMLSPGQSMLYEAIKRVNDE